MTAEQNYRLLLEIDANRRFILQSCRDNPALPASAAPRIRQSIQFDRSNAAGAQWLNASTSAGEGR